jgi:hypothetical protein
VAKQIAFIYQGKQIKLRFDPNDEYVLPTKGDVVALERVAYRVLSEPEKRTASGDVPLFTIYLGSDSDLAGRA